MTRAGASAVCAAAAAGGLLAIDVSNSHIGLALWPDDGSRGERSPGGNGPDPGPPIEHWQIATDTRRTPDEYRILFGRLLAGSDLAPEAVGSVVMACVVPEVTEPLTSACRRLFGLAPMQIGPGLRSGLRIRTESPRELGPDRVANAVAARARFGAPVVVMDFGTALTVDVVDAAGDYAGAIIAPGIEIAAQALAERTARLRRIDLVAPDAAIARDTEGALRSGLVYGYLALVEGLVERLRGQLDGGPVVATGDAPWLAALLEHSQAFDHHLPLLTLEGLWRIHGMNVEDAASNPTSPRDVG